MRAIKNFFHNINDILLAIIIVAVASGIIYWRMGIILDYPKQLAAEQAAYEQEAEETEDLDLEEAAEDEEADATDSADSEQTEADASEEAEAGASAGEAQPQG